MSKHKRTLAKLGASTPCANIKWEELRGLLTHLGYHMLTNSGSRRKFYHKDKDDLIILHCPHPSPDVDKGAISDVIFHLKSHGFI
jgi:predicted RNA binding protein YcfA (HicA-like mRNA interferase family)